ncbi:MAG: AEC family transporter [Clostridia bacterium]|nr:AEC family transporter [Clostridia bacterium]
MGNYSIRVIEKIIVLFIAMIAGFIAKKGKLINVESTKSLSSLLVYITNPCLIIYSMQMEYDSDVLFVAGCVFLLSIAIHTFLAIFSHFVFKPVKNKSERSVYTYALTYSNCGYMGYPIMMAIFGNEVGLFYGVIFTVGFNLFSWTHGVIVMNNKAGIPWKKLVYNPALISVILSIILFITRIRFPRTITDGLSLVGDMTFPLSMVIIGSLLADMKLLEILKQKKLYLFSLLGLIGMPAIMTLVAVISGLPEYLSIIGITMCAAPVAANTAVTAEVYGNDSALAARLVGITTLFCLVTMPLMLWISQIVL